MFELMSFLILFLLIEKTLCHIFWSCCSLFELVPDYSFNFALSLSLSLSLSLALSLSLPLSETNKQTNKTKQDTPHKNKETK
jgi:hypothetical protein